MSNNILVKSLNTVRVSSVSVGRPVRRVIQSPANISTLQGVDMTNRVDGSILIYNASTEKFEATNDLEKQTINGGSF